jgi:hypothetical protein
MARKLRCLPVLLAVGALLVAACAGPANHDFPRAAGEYPLQTHTVAFDGREYSFAWIAPDTSIHQAKGPDVQLVQDERSYLSVGQGTPVLHLTPDEPIAVRGKDRDGAFTSSWFPFFLGYALASSGPLMGGPAPTQPGYRYPPTDTFSRGDTLHGAESTTRAAPPDYSKVKPAPNAVSGQNAGTGAGAAASNRDTNAAVSGQSGGAGSGAAASDKGSAVSGQSGGGGTGDAASNKGQTTTGGGASAAPGGGSGASAVPASGSGPAAPAAAAPSNGSSNRSGPAAAPGGARSGGRR